MLDHGLIEEFQLDWKLAGKSATTAQAYGRSLVLLSNSCEQLTLTTVKSWVASTTYTSVRRKRAQAIRAFGQWCEKNEYDLFKWWKQVPLATEKSKPQQTVTPDDYKKSLGRMSSHRDKAVIELLWSCGLRRSELAALMVADVDLANGCLVVRESKNGKHRVAPLSPSARRALRRHLGSRTTGSLFGMSSNAVRLLLKRSDVPSAHAWRRGWAVHALRSGVSEASVRSAAGWQGSVMVSLYTRTLAGELAMDEFSRVWNS
jgi:integrase/recombinase XerD